MMPSTWNKLPSLTFGELVCAFITASTSLVEEHSFYARYILSTEGLVSEVFSGIGIFIEYCRQLSFMCRVCIRGP